MRTKDECQIADSLGCILSRSREEIRRSIPEVAAELGVPERWVRLAEADRWSEMPDDAYSRIYLKSYCRRLGLDTAAMTGLYRQVRQRSGLSAKKPSGNRRHPTTAVPQWQLMVTSQVLRRSGAGLLSLGLVGYFWWAMAGIVTPPRIAVMSPADGFVTEESSVTLEGVTEAEVLLRINGKEVPPDGQGRFRDTLELADGLNTIQITGAKKHSRETTVIRRVIVQPSAQPTALLGPVEPAANGQPIPNQTSP